MSFFSKENNRKLFSFIFMVVGLSLVTVSPSLAQEFGGITTFIDGIVRALTGPLGIACAALAVIAIGFVFMTGRMDWTFAISVIIGIAIVFGGASFVSGLTAN
ncbi:MULTISPECIES: TrbC/VirB2 family protein [Brucella/Ochrobactrum group]|uniref:TrbC/VirB2 family protein n=1 Tax=Brucella/Ochrobactrum group TaxID=2826938 RepID=UPI001C059E7D|nr:TrbC/VirB2 family protein [Brucella sp. NBRC 12950]QWK80634.1 TrbC/VirB2 family protein [Ochrobactrum sp. BTU1]GLU27955.1 hypothetical protein Brsp01_31880 [Brucella sp. NBRC 12950]